MCVNVWLIQYACGQPTLEKVKSDVGLFSRPFQRYCRMLKALIRSLAMKGKVDLVGPIKRERFPSSFGQSEGSFIIT